MAFATRQKIAQASRISESLRSIPSFHEGHQQAPLAALVHFLMERRSEGYASTHALHGQISPGLPGGRHRWRARARNSMVPRLRDRHAPQSIALFKCRWRLSATVASACSAVGDGKSWDVGGAKTKGVRPCRRKLAPRRASCTSADSACKSPKTCRLRLD